MGHFFHDKGFIYISHKYKIIFIPIPKNGSTSIRKIPEFKFKQDKIFYYMDGILHDEYKVFTVIRNPVERIVSGYVETILRGYNNKSFDYLWIKDPRKRFKQFIVELEERIFDPHLWPQHYLLTDYNNKYFKNVRLLNFDEFEYSFHNYMISIGLDNIHFLREQVYNRKKSTFNFGKLSKSFSKLIHLRYNTAKSDINYKVDYYRHIYIYLNSLIRYLTYRRNLPDKEYILSLIQSDNHLTNSIQEIYFNDFQIYNKVKTNKGVITTNDLA